MRSTTTSTAAAAPEIQTALAGQPAEVATRVVVHEVIAAGRDSLFDCRWYLLQLLAYNSGHFLKLLLYEAPQFLHLGRHYLELLLDVVLERLHLLADLVFDVFLRSVEIQIRQDIERASVCSNPFGHV